MHDDIDNLIKNKRQQVVRHMKNLGVYKADYGTTLDIFSEMLVMYEIWMRELRYSGYQVQEAYTNKAGATNMRKTPQLAAIEKIRSDIATYSNMLGLNPKAFETLTAIENKKSPLVEALEKHGKT